METSVFIVVDLDATAAPPATDSVRQLLSLIEGLPTDNGELDWRLVSLSLNSPLKAELRAFTPNGDAVSEARVVSAAEVGFEVFRAVNDNVGNTALALERIGETQRSRLRKLLMPLKGRTGSIEVTLSGQFDYRVTAHRAEIALEEIDRLDRSLERRPTPPSPELGAVEGQITEATTYYGRPALKVRRHLTDDIVTCIFDRNSVAELGAEHTLDEVWSGRRVVVDGKLIFGPDGRLTQVQASDMRALKAPLDVLTLLREAKEKGEVPAPLADWGADD